jgi:hypothetical protein
VRVRVQNVGLKCGACSVCKRTLVPTEFEVAVIRTREIVVRYESLIIT